MAKDPGQRQWNVTALLAELESSATAAYGPDWEHRGLVTLGGLVAALGAVLPAAVLGGTLLPAGGSIAGEAARALGGKGVLAKVGTAKAAGGAEVAAAAGTMLAVLLWPDPPGVGGSSSADYRAYFTRPAIVLANDTIPDGDNDASPLIAIKQTITPARAKAGTRVRLAMQWHGRTPWGLQYLGPGRFRCQSPNSERADDLHRGYSFGLGGGVQDGARGGTPRVWLHRSGDKPAAELPTGNPVPLKATHWKGQTSKKYDDRICAWIFDQPMVSEFVIPSQTSLRPGKYKVSPHNPVGIAEVKATVGGRLTSITPASAGARAEGALPTLQILSP